MYDLEKIINKNRQLSLNAIGLITYIVLVKCSLEDENKKTLCDKLKIGKDALNSAFKELIDADIIEIKYKNNGRFIYSYIINDYYEI